MSTTAADLSVLLYEGPGAERLEIDRRAELLTELLEAGHPVTRRTQGDALATSPPGLAVLALGSPPAGATVSTENGNGARAFVDLSDQAPADTRARIDELRKSREMPTPGAWTPWFPVIDYSRCTNCMQCLSFCLFDVYGVDADGKIEVRNEDKCKTNCPACSRVCPDVAILFPKYTKGPINGDQVREADIQKESMKVDISSLLGGDIYASLRKRSTEARQRFSTERDESKALLERKRCLKALQKDLDIPDEVLMSLPSAGEIEERTKRAREKMERRRKVSQSIKDQVGEPPAPSQKEWGI